MKQAKHTVNQNGSRHTPGWRFLPTHWAGGSATAEINRIKIEDDEVGIVAYIEHHGRGTGNEKSPTDQDYDRARLIAAAPETAAERDRLREVNRELIEALWGMVNSFAPHDGIPEDEKEAACKCAQTVLAKAEGEKDA